MFRKVRPLIFIIALIAAAGMVHSQSELCNTVDMKPVLSLQQVNQAEFVHYMASMVGVDVPPSSAATPEEQYEKEVQALVDAGFPPALADAEPDRLVTRRYFASMMFPIAVTVDDEFAAQYGDLTDETQQLEALVNEDWLYAEEGRIYREEMLSILCVHEDLLQNLAAGPPQEVQEITPVEIREGNIETEASPI